MRLFIEPERARSEALQRFAYGFGVQSKDRGYYDYKRKPMTTKESYDLPFSASQQWFRHGSFHAAVG
jgi:hypothetical protein